MNSSCMIVTVLFAIACILVDLFSFDLKDKIYIVEKGFDKGDPSFYNEEDRSGKHDHKGHHNGSNSYLIHKNQLRKDINEFKNEKVQIQDIKKEEISEKDEDKSKHITSWKYIAGVKIGLYRSKIENKKASSSLDLSQIEYLHTPTKENKDEKIIVCVFNRTPNHRGLFSTNRMSIFGSGKYEYKSMYSTNCQHQGTCKNANEARIHKECNATINPTVYLLERFRIWQHDRFDKVLEKAKEFWDIVIVSGDEYCQASYANNRTHYRMYYGPNVVAPETLVTSQDIERLTFQTNVSNPSWNIINDAAMKNTPYYLPLGPREEFLSIYPKDVIPVDKRKYLFNFVGSLTSKSRIKLKKELLKIHDRIPNNYIHFTDEWSKEISQDKGYLSPNEYKNVVMNSIFTLCPQGHNPEAYRIFEACEAGSIPIVVLDENYRNHKCKNSFLPLIRAGAPIVFLKNWEQLQNFLEKIEHHQELLQRMQINIVEWYSKYMKAIANDFETRLIQRFQERFMK